MAVVQVFPGVYSYVHGKLHKVCTRSVLLDTFTSIQSMYNTLHKHNIIQLNQGYVHVNVCVI